MKTVHLLFVKFLLKNCCRKGGYTYCVDSGQKNKPHKTWNCIFCTRYTKDIKNYFNHILAAQGPNHLYIKMYLKKQQSTLLLNFMCFINLLIKKPASLFFFLGGGMETPFERILVCKPEILCFFILATTAIVYIFIIISPCLRVTTLLLKTWLWCLKGAVARCDLPLDFQLTCSGKSIEVD